MTDPPKELLKVFKREGGTKQAEVVHFAPVKGSRRVDTVTEVIMLASVGGKHPDGERWELEAGKEFILSSDLADKFIVNGWALGQLSREYSADEIAEIRSRSQNIRFEEPDTTGGTNG